MIYNKDNLRIVLTNNGYTPQVMSPEWCNFALNILIIERLDKILKGKKNVTK